VTVTRGGAMGVDLGARVVSYVDPSGDVAHLGSDRLHEALGSLRSGLDVTGAIDGPDV
jgi:hypothetical protein